MSDPDPIVLRRMLALRPFRLLAGAELAELAMLAENVVEVTVPAGGVVGPSEGRFGELHFVVDGRIESGTTSWGARDVCGALEVLAGRGMATPAIATEATRTYQLSRGDLGEILEDNFGVLRSVLRELAVRAIDTGVRPAAQVRVRARSGPLGLVERLILLRQQLPFARASLQALARLAHEAEELSVAAGTVLVRAGDPSGRALVIADGTLRGGPVLYGSGDAVGLIETLAGSRAVATLEAVTPVRVLAYSAAAMLDVLEDHTELGLGMLSTLAAALLDAPRRDATSN